MKDVPVAQASDEVLGDPAGVQAAATPEAPSLPRYDLRVHQALRRIVRGVDLYSRKLFVMHKITGPQLICLLAVQEREPATASAIAREIHLSASTVVGILDRLETKGLVRRQRNSTDRRVVHVWLTGAGRELLERAPSPLQDSLTEAMSELPEEEVAAMAESLETIVEIMEVRDINAAQVLETGPIEQGDLTSVTNAFDVKAAAPLSTSTDGELLQAQNNQEKIT